MVEGGRLEIYCTFMRTGGSNPSLSAINLICNMKILLTGGSGMVGSFLTPYLKDIHELKIFDLREPKYDDVEFVQGLSLIHI